MRKQVSQFWQNYSMYIAILAGLAGLVYFLYRALAFAETLPTIVWDESMYLYKGYLFALGRYQPFEDFGPWTNQLPVSFLIPGYIQKWFGAGMRTGRMYAVVFGALAVIGVWWTVYRNASPWWGAAVVWVVALNPAYVQVFSQSFAQTLVSMLFAWMLFFGLGRDRNNLELALAAFLAGLAGMSRVNVLPALPLFVVYIFWQYGRRSGFIALAAGLLPIIGFHALYWPDILKFWAYWIPSERFPWIVPYKSPWREIFLPDDFAWFPLSTWINDPDHLAWVGVRSFWQAVRVNFVVIFGVIAAMIFWPWRKFDQSRSRAWGFSDRDQFIYLLTSFLVLYGVHVWAANGQGCRFVCLPGYIMFFFVFGLALVPISAAHWNLDKPALTQFLMVILVLGLMVVLEYNYNFSYLDFRYDLVRNTFDVEIPRMKEGRIVEGTGKVWELLENKFGYDHFPLRQFVLKDETSVQIVRLVKVFGLILIVIPFTHWLWERFNFPSIEFGSFTVLFILVMGVVFSGSRFFGGHLVMETCSDSVIEDYDGVGAALNDLIPPGSQVYWSVKADMLLLYLPEVEVFTPQLNAFFTYVDDPEADPETLYRFGWWNEILKEEWIVESDYILIENRFFDQDWQERLDEGSLEQVYLSAPVASCRGDDSRIVVLAPVEP